MRALVILIAVLMSAAPVLAQGENEVRRFFKDWLAACRADGYCSATAYQNANSGDGMVADYVLRVGRHAQETYWEISFTTVATMGDAAAPFRVSVDGSEEVFSGPEQVAAYGALNDFFLLGQRAQAVMDRLAPGSSVAIDFVDQDGAAQRAEFSLSGLTAALIWIDERQQRLGSERVAEAPPVGLEPVPVDGAAAAEIPPVLLALRGADAECGPLDQIANGRDIEVDLELGEGQKLYILPCWAAAYNFGWKAYLESFGEFTLASFAEYSPSTGWTATTHLVNYSYDPATRQIATYYKGRGIGDCGTAGLWQWNEFQFRLLEFSSKEECDGVGVGEFPVVYEADPLPAGRDQTGPADRQYGQVGIAGIPQALLSSHAARGDECDPFDTMGNGDEFYVHDLGDERTLYLVPCTSGAYNFFYAAYVASEFGYELQTFAAYQLNGGWVGESGIWFSEFDPETRTLHGRNLGRGAGDCGTTATWQWEAVQFVLVKATAKPECDEEGEPGVFPVIYERK